MAVAFSGLLIAAASAKTAQEIPYAFEVVWPTALRFVRVDNDWKLGEQNREAGFFRFELVVVEEKQRILATLELISTTDRLGREAVRMQLTAPGLSGYRESIYLEKLARKVKEEQGPPADPKRARKGAREEASGRADGAVDAGVRDASQ